MFRDPESEEPHLVCKVKVPMDTFSLDLVFGNVPGGEGLYDNAEGLDYHVPVFGGTAVPPRIHVMHVAVEMAPIAKVGGLGDVVLSLGRAVADNGHLVEVILPKYRFFDQSPLLKEMKHETQFQWGGTHINVMTCVVEGLRVFFIDPGNGFFDVQSPYGRNNDGQRFDFFCKAALEFLLVSGRKPDILHCHDWSSAEISKSYWTEWWHHGLKSAKVVFTIHNMEYGKPKIGDAVWHSQVVTTVSPSYAGEARSSSFPRPVWPSALCCGFVGCLAVLNTDARLLSCRCCSAPLHLAHQPHASHYSPPLHPQSLVWTDRRAARDWQQRLEAPRCPQRDRCGHLGPGDGRLPAAEIQRGHDGGGEEGVPRAAAEQAGYERVERPADCRGGVAPDGSKGHPAHQARGAPLAVPRGAVRPPRVRFSPFACSRLAGWRN